MINKEVVFHNKASMKVQAQIFLQSTLISTCVANPDETCKMPAISQRYDIFLKNGATGWEIARKLGSESHKLTLSKHKGKYVITEG
jgi:hypothetical protein